jgi:hypothetical protein
MVSYEKQLLTIAKNNGYKHHVDECGINVIDCKTNKKVLHATIQPNDYREEFYLFVYENASKNSTTICLNRIIKELQDNEVVTQYGDYDFVIRFYAKNIVGYEKLFNIKKKRVYSDIVLDKLRQNCKKMLMSSKKHV